MYSKVQIKSYCTFRYMFNPYCTYLNSSIHILLGTVTDLNRAVGYRVQIQTLPIVHCALYIQFDQFQGIGRSWINLIISYFRSIGRSWINIMISYFRSIGRSWITVIISYFRSIGRSWITVIISYFRTIGRSWINVIISYFRSIGRSWINVILSFCLLWTMSPITLR